jgi:hypothetical protein
MLYEAIPTGAMAAPMTYKKENASIKVGRVFNELLQQLR